jgi:hypothetical protein
VETSTLLLIIGLWTVNGLAFGAIIGIELASRAERRRYYN